MDPLWHAMSKLRRGKLDDCISIADEVLAKNPRDKAAWMVKCKAVTKQNYIDDIELDEEGIADALLVEAMIRHLADISRSQIRFYRTHSYISLLHTGRERYGFRTTTRHLSCLNLRCHYGDYLWV